MYQYSQVSYREAIVREVAGPLNDVKSRWKMILLLGAAASFVIALFTVVKTAASISDFPIVYAAAFWKLVQLSSVLGLILIGVIAHVTSVFVRERSMQSWEVRARVSRPGESFGIPYIRFQILAVVLAVVMFLIMAIPLIIVIWGLPEMVPEFSRASAYVNSVFRPGIGE